MNQNYNFKSLQFDKKEGDENKINLEKINVFETGEAKTIDFIQKDGTRQNLPYSHYMTAWMGQEKEERFIKIFFATHLVTIRGYCLDELYNHLIKFELKSITANDERYSNDVSDEKPFVISIGVEWREKKVE